MSLASFLPNTWALLASDPALARTIEARHALVSQALTQRDRLLERVPKSKIVAAQESLLRVQEPGDQSRKDPVSARFSNN